MLVGFALGIYFCIRILPCNKLLPLTREHVENVHVGLFLPFLDAVFHFLIYFPPLQRLCLSLSFFSCTSF